MDIEIKDWFVGGIFLLVGLTSGFLVTKDRIEKEAVARGKARYALTMQGEWRRTGFEWRTDQYSKEEVDKMVEEQVKKFRDCPNCELPMLTEEQCCQCDHKDWPWCNCSRCESEFQKRQESTREESRDGH